ncbi:MAG TPA: YhjD/YihY/BrkB family envelope integrity protein [Anaeromyxobacteraceae bacterium]|nr:YhjD/YihY/BrkB family envelope integrity protein [Anaeromyxobacteraceae bacterium]
MRAVERAASLLGRLRRWIRFAPTAIETALRVLEGETVRLRAMALTYISLFALVPGLVVAFSVVEAFTGMERVRVLVNDALLENLAVGARESLEPHLERFIANAHAGSAGLVGGALLVWSSVTLFSNLDRAVNDIWGIRRRRPVGQQAIIYWMGLTLGPILLAASVALGVEARGWLAGTGTRTLGVAAGVLLTCAFFATLYLIVPATKVRFWAAAAGGLVAGLAWEGAKLGYTYFVARVFRYHAIYGSVAAVPVFILWLFVSWAILLFGARLAYVFQYASTFRPAAAPAAPGTAREILAGEAMLVLAGAFDRGEEPLDAGDVAGHLRATPEEVGEVLGKMREASLLVAAAEGGLLPARPLERITLLDVRRAVSGAHGAAGPGAPLVERLVREAEAEAAERLAGATLRSLLDGSRGGGPSGGAAGGPGSGPAGAPGPGPERA